VINTFNYNILNKFKQPLRDWLIEDLPAPSVIPRYTLTVSQLNSYQGHYESAVQRFSRVHNKAPKTIELKLINGKLHRSSENGKRWFELIPVTVNHFRDRDQSVASSAIVLAPDGEQYLQGYFGSYRKID
jgi:lipopolysaccharide biosynthesis regulator YciM